MSNPAPTVSIAIRAYRKRWLGEAIESVLEQTYRDLELVVYDDAGDLDELVTRFEDPRIRYHRPRERRPTTSGRFIEALSLCRGRYLGVLDDDDRYEARFVERLVGALEEDPDAGIAFCRLLYEVDGDRYAPPDPRRPGRQPDALREILAYRAFVVPSMMLVRREAAEDAEARCPTPEGVAPDAFLNVHAALAGWRHVCVDSPLAVRRWHPGQAPGRDAIRQTIETFRGFSIGDGELEGIRRAVLARKLLWGATYELAAGERGAAQADLAEAAAADATAWRAPRWLIGVAARVPALGPAAARIVLGLFRARARRSGPPPPARVPRPAGQVARDAAALAVGSVGAQLLLVLVSPLLTRLYTPAELGAAGVVVGAMVAVGPLACLRFDVAIPLAEERREAAGLFALCLALGVASTTALIVATALLGPPLVELANVPEMEGWAWLVPAQAAIAAIGLSCAGALIRRRRFASLAGTRLTQASAQSGAQLAAGAAGAAAPGFAAGVALGACGYSTAAAVAAARIEKDPPTPREALAAMRPAARRWRRFAAWSTFGASLHTGSLALLPLLVAASFGPAAAGLFLLAQRVLGVPVNVAGEAISSAWFGTAAEIVRERRPGLREALRAVTRSLVLGGGALLAIVLIAGPPLFPTIFGDEWTGGGELLLALAPLYFAVLAAIPAGQTLQALGRTDLLTGVAAARLAAGALSILGGGALGWSLTAALGIYAAAMATISGAVALLAWRLSDPATDGASAYAPSR